MKGLRRLIREVAIGAVVMSVAPAATLAQDRAGVVTTLQGSATVTRVSLPRPAPLRFKDDVFVHDRIVTGDSSVARILLGGKAVVTVRERSVLSITESATTSTIDLTTGRIALAVAKERMKPGEAVEIRTPNAVAGIRGTVIVAEVAPANGMTTTFTLLTGVVDVATLDAARSIRTPAGVLQRLQSLTIVGGAPQRVRDITRSEARRIGSDYTLRVTSESTPVIGSQNELQRAAAALGNGDRTPSRARERSLDDASRGARPGGDDRGGAVGRAGVPPAALAAPLAGSSGGNSGGLGTVTDDELRGVTRRGKRK